MQVVLFLVAARPELPSVGFKVIVYRLSELILCEVSTLCCQTHSISRSCADKGQVLGMESRHYATNTLQYLWWPLVSELHDPKCLFRQFFDDRVIQKNLVASSSKIDKALQEKNQCPVIPDAATRVSILPDKHSGFRLERLNALIVLSDFNAVMYFSMITSVCLSPHHSQVIYASSRPSEME